MHCDLKPGNVLLKSTSSNRRGFTCKLCDFGMSRVLDKQQATHVSTQTYGVRTANIAHSIACPATCQDLGAAPLLA